MSSTDESQKKDSYYKEADELIDRAINEKSRSKEIVRRKIRKIRGYSFERNIKQVHII